jgi:hypothetical protein
VVVIVSVSVAADAPAARAGGANAEKADAEAAKMTTAKRLRANGRRPRTNLKLSSQFDWQQRGNSPRPISGVRRYGASLLPPVARVIVPEEKGSDVNLATYVLYDALIGARSKAIVVSNDSDLCEAIRLSVKYGVPVGIVNQHQGPASGKLLKVASFEVPFRREALAKCQLPNAVALANGKAVTKPARW